MKMERQQLDAGCVTSIITINDQFRRSWHRAPVPASAPSEVSSHDCVINARRAMRNFPAMPPPNSVSVPLLGFSMPDA
jgi:hypothetical protein